MFLEMFKKNSSMTSFLESQAFMQPPLISRVDLWMDSSIDSSQMFPTDPRFGSLYAKA
jgi:hypothetical protein